MRRLLPLAAALVFLACVAHEKAGDRAASVGDWKTAERAYSEALRKDPDKKELQEKYRQARAAALDEAIRAADACAAARDVECAFAESDYALRLDPGNAAMATLRRDAGREVGLARVRSADEATRAGDFHGALQLLEQAREVTDDAAVAAEGRRVQPRAVAGAVELAERYRAARQYPQALEVLALAARADPAQRDRLDATAAEYERFKDAEAERLTEEGEARLEKRRFADAKASFDAAVQLRPRGRAEPLARYAGHLARAEAAVARKDFPAAEAALGEALRAGVADRFAAEELDRVRVRPYAIRLRSVLVRAARPDGWPWAGGRSREYDRVAARLDRLDGREAVAGHALDLARRIPAENQPTLVLAVGLPDGRAFRTAPRRGVYALLDGSVVVRANAYDDRPLSIRVVHEVGGGARPMDVGVVTFRLGDVIASRGAASAGHSVLELRVDADPADAPEGSFAGLVPVTVAATPAPGR